MEKSKVKFNLRVAGVESKMLPNPEWRFLKVTMADPTWELTVPGSGNGKLAISADWSVSKFNIGLLSC